MEAVLALARLLGAEISVCLAVSLSTSTTKVASWHPSSPLQGCAPLGPAVWLYRAGTDCRRKVTWLSQESDYWQSILIYINNSAILTILFIVLISGILVLVLNTLCFIVLSTHSRGIS